MQKRNTAQKKAIFDELSSRKDHPSATRLYEDLKERYPNLSRATVYRVLNMAADEGKILRIHAGTEDHFDGTQGHCHIICTNCDHIYDAPFPQGIVDSLSAESGYQVGEQNVIFYGLCPSCQNLLSFGKRK